MGYQYVSCEAMYLCMELLQQREHWACPLAAQSYCAILVLAFRPSFVFVDCVEFVYLQILKQREKSTPSDLVG